MSSTGATSQSKQSRHVDVGRPRKLVTFGLTAILVCAPGMDGLALVVLASGSRSAPGRPARPPLPPSGSSRPGVSGCLRRSG